MEKTRLQMFVQKSRLGLPSYTCTKEGPPHTPRFKASVLCDGECFECPDTYKTKRDAESAAAEVALKSLLARKNPMPQVSQAEDGTAKSDVSPDKSVEYKILLQEATQKAKVPSPIFLVSSFGQSHLRTFTCTVEVAGMSFTGESSKTKKQAENSAASAAWFALKNCCNEKQNLEIDEGTDDKRGFSHVVSTLAKKLMEEEINTPALGNLYKDAPPTKRLRVVLSDKDSSWVSQTDV